MGFGVRNFCARVTLCPIRIKCMGVRACMRLFRAQRSRFTDLCSVRAVAAVPPRMKIGRNYLFNFK